MNKQEAFEEINRTQDEYIDELIALINNPDYEVMKSVNFTSPTGTGKTKMMSKLINRFPDYYFIITTLSRGQLNQQVRADLVEDCEQDNFYVYGSADYRINSKLEANDIIGRIPPNTRCIWLRDEGHIKTNRFDELLKNSCYKVINFSATNEHSDIKCNFTNTMMLRTVNQSCGTPEDAIHKLLEVKEIHKEIKGYNPCAIFRCVGNDTKLQERIVRLCDEYNLKHIDLIDSTPDVTIAELCKDDNEYDVIINKFKITEGINIKRAHILYMDNKPNNNATTIQVIGRCRRNALLYRDDIDILAPENSRLLEKTRECFVFYNVEKMKIASDENGELQYAFCDHISCEELKPNTTIEVVNGQLANGLYIMELEGQTGKFEVMIDEDTGFNVVSPLTEFYNTRIKKNDCIYLGKKLSHRIDDWKKIKLENIMEFPIYDVRYTTVFDYSLGEYKVVENKCEPYFDIFTTDEHKLTKLHKINPNAISAFETRSEQFLKLFSKTFKTNQIDAFIGRLNIPIIPNQEEMKKYVDTYLKKLQKSITYIDDEVLGKIVDTSTSDGRFYRWFKVDRRSETLGKNYHFVDYTTVNYSGTLLSRIADYMSDHNFAIYYYSILKYEKNPCMETCEYIVNRLTDFFKLVSSNSELFSDLIYSYKMDYEVSKLFSVFIPILFDDTKYAELKSMVFRKDIPHFILKLKIQYRQWSFILEETKINSIFDEMETQLKNTVFITSAPTPIKKQLKQEFMNTLNNLNQGLIDCVEYDASYLFEELTEQDKAMSDQAKRLLTYEYEAITCSLWRKLSEKSHIETTINDKESAIVGVDTMQLLSDSNTWIEAKAVSNKVGSYTKLNAFISKKYAKELEQAKTQQFTGKNTFTLDTKCNACIGYCVEYYSKYLLYGETYLKDFIDKALQESKTEIVNDGIIIRACMLKYREMMMIAFGSSVSKIIKSVSVQKLVQDEYKYFVGLVKELGTRTAEYVRKNLYDGVEPTNSVDPNLSITHITGLADYITKDTILDVKVKNNIGDKEVRQVLAYHYLSTKRSDLHIKRVIVFDATSGKAVVIPIEPENVV